MQQNTQLLRFLTLESPTSASEGDSILKSRLEAAALDVITVPLEITVIVYVGELVNRLRVTNAASPTRVFPLGGLGPRPGGQFRK